MTSTLPASSHKCCGSRPRTAAQQRPSGRSHSTRTDPSTITSPTTRSRTQIRPGIHGADQNTHERNHSPPQPLTRGPVQISSTRARGSHTPESAACPFAATFQAGTPDSVLDTAVTQVLCNYAAEPSPSSSVLASGSAHSGCAAIAASSSARFGIVSPCSAASTRATSRVSPAKAAGDHRHGGPSDSHRQHAEVHQSFRPPVRRGRIFLFVVALNGRLLDDPQQGLSRGVCYVIGRQLKPHGRSDGSWPARRFVTDGWSQRRRRSGRQGTRRAQSRNG
jgi:hypothetical protein